MRVSGAGRLLLDSSWRRQRLLILCYHGVALEDEHRWNPKLYVTAEHLRKRLEALRRWNCNILGLGKAVELLFAGSLPPRSVVLTFDDGFYDFIRVAAPVLAEYRAPATVYVTTYYCRRQQPVFNPMVSYLLWKGAATPLRWQEVLGNEDGRDRGAIGRRIRAYAAENGLSGADKDRLLDELAERLDVDFAPIRSRRILHLMNDGELRSAAASGFDLQLHTHRHRVPRERAAFDREIAENREVLAAAGAAGAAQFCYPSGVNRPECGEWLQELGVRSATTTDLGLAGKASDPFRLPRVLDSLEIDDLTFESWATGAADLIPHRHVEHPEENNQ